MEPPARTPALPFPERLDDRLSGEPPSSVETEIVVLFDSLRPRLLRYILGFGLPISDAEEIVQECFLALHRHLLQGKSRENLSAWLYQVAHNLSLKRRIAAARMPESRPADLDYDPPDPTDPALNPEDSLAVRQRQDRLRSVVRALPDADRQCLYLRAEGLRYRQIAQVLGISVGSVANSLARSLARLAAVDGR